MIIVKLLTVVLDMIWGFLEMFSFVFGMSSADGVFGPNLLETYGEIFRLVNYFLPLAKMLVLLMITYSVEIIALVWRLLMRIKSFIPTMGN